TTWSEPLKVNQDTSKNHQFFTWMDIDQINGNLWFVYHDRRNHEDTGTDFYVAVSEDGGLSFKEAKISESPFYPNPEIFFGDYNNIAAHGNVVRPVWTRLDGNDISVKTAILDVHSILEDDSHSITTRTDSGGNITIQHPLKGKVTVNIHSLDGHESFTKTKVKSKGGILTISETSDFQSGIYSVEVDNGTKKAKGQWIKR
ncbi:MAG: T9SS type A sorting domain-containing protein, partial [Cryomorphaceae bacterium]